MQCYARGRATLARLAVSCSEVPLSDVESHGGDPAREGRGAGRCACRRSCAARAPAAAAAGDLQPQGKKIFFGISDTGDPADFGEFSKLPAQAPGADRELPHLGHATSPTRSNAGRTARARPILHITTADNSDGHELITPRAIAQGDGDEYLIRLNKLFWAKKMRAYIRPLGEPNRCLNVYASYDCAGNPRDAAHSPRWYRRAFRRIYVIVHGGGKRGEDRRPPAPKPACRRCDSDVGGLPKAPVAVIWSTLPAGSPTVPQNRPAVLLPGRRIRRLGRDRLLLRQPGLEGAHRPLQPLRHEAVRAARVRRLERRRPALRRARC